MNITDLQKAIGAKADGIWGEGSRKALLNAFTNANPAAGKITPDQLKELATRLKVSVKQIAAVASVEAGGSGYDASGKPKILFERHKFYKLTGGIYGETTFSNKAAGGYNENSWDKLAGAIGTGAVDAAFMSASWGKFQVMGEYWDEFHFASPFAFAFSTVASEKAHYEMLANYVEVNHLQDEMAKLSTNPEDCRAFAKAYNGPAYVNFNYHSKLAQAMK
ncbi:DUF3380 domain-containing protein [Novosphingobium umbonatum]|uniref:DUF3380 domain-containing protein n=1 Tax=Novosphingobium umbonatum TaxID=1908524 RepID=A0A3S2UQD2_9SPHN|nr:N-acetylmuramidase domain-containing protein [Novosphingobium umbonatum]RVU04246.1 DUF3380 domain-containing protein [Novosphingobium umbonatum]